MFLLKRGLTKAEDVLLPEARIHQVMRPNAPAAASVFTACFRWLKAFSQKYLNVGIRMLACSSQHVIFNFKLLHFNMVDPRFFVVTQKETHQFWEPFFKTHTHTHAPTSFHSLQALAMSFGPAIQLVAGCDVGSGHESRGIFHVHFILWVP